ncbi:PSP1 C-terminal conserved region-domain-containing protein, partial [Protomyces lactucae-debilis]
LFLVEFKACRTDVFYVPEGSGMDVHVGDLVLVEADRGRDLGKVTHESVTLAQVRQLKQQQAREQALALGGGLAMLQPKLIYRLAHAAEAAQLLVKSQDEQQAMLVCQAKVRQRKLPMEVLDGEYQWDRRKLTFYYIASQRIDFRDLVRDLFKIYKTRIWMCAVNP